MNNQGEYTTEIRWFDVSDQLAEKLIASLSLSHGRSQKEKRIDYYLRSLTALTGVKIRENRQEIKIKYAEDKKKKYGIIQQWIKWSNLAQPSILTIDEELQKDWIAVSKKRNLWVFNKNNKIDSNLKDQGGDGFQIEIGKLKIGKGKSVNTIAVEVFGHPESQHHRFTEAVKVINPILYSLSKCNSMSYPEYLCDKINCAI